MRNVNIVVSKDGKSMDIHVDLAQETVESASGKTQIVASTQGNAAASGGWFVGLNVYRYAGPKASK